MICRWTSSVHASECGNLCANSGLGNADCSGPSCRHLSRCEVEELLERARGQLEGESQKLLEPEQHLLLVAGLGTVLVRFEPVSQSAKRCKIVAGRHCSPLALVPSLAPLQKSIALHSKPDLLELVLMDDHMSPQQNDLRHSFQITSRDRTQYSKQPNNTPAWTTLSQVPPDAQLMHCRWCQATWDSSC